MKHGLYCSAYTVLLHAYRKKMLTFSTKAVVIFWIFEQEKALERFSKNEASQAHSEAVLKVTCAATVNVGSILDVCYKQQQLTRQRYVDETASFPEIYLVHQA